MHHLRLLYDRCGGVLSFLNGGVFLNEMDGWMGIGIGKKRKRYPLVNQGAARRWCSYYVSGKELLGPKETCLLEVTAGWTYVQWRSGCYRLSEWGLLKEYNDIIELGLFYLLFYEVYGVYEVVG